MGQQSNGISLRFGVSDGWDSSWSIKPDDKMGYRDLVQISSDVEKLVTCLFKANHGFLGKVGISKSAQTNKIYINVFGCVPRNYTISQTYFVKNDGMKKKVVATRPINCKQQLIAQLYKLADILSTKYSYLGVTFAVKGYVKKEYRLLRQFKRGGFKKRKKDKSFKFKNKFYRSIYVRAGDINPENTVKYLVPKQYALSFAQGKLSTLMKQRFFKKHHKKKFKRRQNRLKLPKTLFRCLKKFGYLKRMNYYTTLMNIAFWALKTKQPSFLAKFLAQEFSKTRYQRSLYNNVNRICAFLYNEFEDIQGLRIQVSGRLNKSKRTQTYVCQYGAISTQTMAFPLKYAFEEAYTVYGSMGVKVWISY